MKTAQCRVVLGLTCAAALAFTGCGPGITGVKHDENYPSQRIEITVPYGAGGATDTNARAVADGMARELGVDVQVVNKPGSAGAIGTSEAAHAKATGYELLFAPASSFTAVPNLQDVNYGEDDFVGIARMYEQGYGLVTRTSEFDELDDLAAKTGRLTYAFTGTGNPTNLASEDFASEAGLQVEGVPFDAATDAIQAVRGGQVDFAIADLNIVGTQVEQDAELSALAVSTEHRQALLPDVPTLHEKGFVTDEVYAARYAIAAPAETPEEIVSKLSESIDSVLTTESYREFAANNYLDPPPDDDAKSWFTEWIPAERKNVAGKFAEFGIGGK